MGILLGAAATPTAPKEMTVAEAEAAKAAEDARLKTLAFKNAQDALNLSFDQWKAKIADLTP